jgi:uncharacterized protein YcgI (DUF1989 family)
MNKSFTMEQTRILDSDWNAYVLKSLIISCRIQRVRLLVLWVDYSVGRGSYFMATACKILQTS